MNDPRRLHLFVYYPVALDRDAPTRARVAAMQDDLHAITGVAGRLMQRPGSKDGFATWMEVYEDVDAGFEARLAEAACRHGLSAGPDDAAREARRVERFVEPTVPRSARCA